MGNSGTFKKGQKPWNKDKKGIHLSPETEFKVGQTAGEKGNKWKGGVQEMKNDCVYLYDGVGKRKRRPRAIYEENFGEIPKGYVIVHSDGDRYNDLPDNLEAISRAELVRRNSGRNT